MSAPAVLVLLAVRAEAGEPAERLDLEAIRAYLDYLDHAVYRDGELLDAIGDLVTAGFLEWADDRIRRTGRVPSTRELRIDQERAILERLLAT